MLKTAKAVRHRQGGPATAYKHHRDITTSPSSSPPPPSVAIIVTSGCGTVGPDGGEPRLALDLRRDRGGAWSRKTIIIHNSIYSATWGQKLAPVILEKSDIAPQSQFLAPVSLETTTWSQNVALVILETATWSQNLAPDSLETTFMEPFQNVG